MPPKRSFDLFSVPDNPRPELPPTSANRYLTGFLPCFSSYSFARSSTVFWRVSIIARVSSRVAVSTIAKLPVTDDCSGALKKRQFTLPEITIVT